MLICEEEMRTFTSELNRKMLIGVALGLMVTFLSRWLFFPSARLVQPRMSSSNRKFTYEKRTENKKFHIPQGRRELVLIGVMTANNFLETRARSVYNTWGREVPGKLLFFTPENANLSSDLPIVALPTVDDTYPPQKKSFLTLKYMHEKYGDKFEWFVRADDDVYIRPDRLEKFLRNLNSSIKYFIGQAGVGDKEEFGRLGFDHGENFCMGGPGMVMSHATLAAVAPNVKTCLQNLYSHHEDTEIGRCVRRFAGINCTWAYEVQNIFHHSSAGKEAFTGNLKTKEVHRAITLHPVKQSNYLYRLHNYMRALEIADLQFEKVKQERLLVNAVSLQKPVQNVTYEKDDKTKGFLTTSFALKYNPRSEREALPWDFISRSWFSLSQINPRRKIDGALQEMLDDLVREVMDGLNTRSRERGRIIDFKEIFYASSQVNPLYGIQHIVDFILIYKKYRGRKMTVLVRHHKIFQQNFEQLDIREVTRKWKSRKSRDVSRRRSRKLLGFRSAEGVIKEKDLRQPHAALPDENVNSEEVVDIPAYEQKIRSEKLMGLSDKEGVPMDARKQNESSRLSKSVDHNSTDGGGADQSTEILGSKQRIITEKNIENKFEHVQVNNNRYGSRHLLSVLKNEQTNGEFSPQGLVDYVEDLEQEYDQVQVDDESNDMEDYASVANGSDVNYERFIEYQYNEIEKSQYKLIHLIVPVAGRLLQFLRFMEEYQKVVLNQNENVELIIVLYEDPKNRNAKVITLDILRKYQEKYENFLLKVFEPSETFSRGKALEYGASLCNDDALLFLNDIDVLFNTDALFRIRQHTLQNRQIYYPVVFSQFDPRSVHGNASNIEMEINELAGYWRAFGYGIVSIYNSDLQNIGGFDKNIVGWGKEDVDLFEKAINSTLTVFRSADPGLIHVFHEIECDENLPEAQKVMCLGSKVNTVFNQKFLAEMILANKTIADFPEFRDIF